MSLLDRSELALLAGVFVAESLEMLSVMEQSLVALERSPDDEELLNTIFRAIHTIKGGAACLDLEPIVQTSHAAEEMLDAIRARRIAVTPQRITLLLRCGDSLRAMVAAAEEGETLLAGDAPLVAAMRAAADGGSFAEDFTASAPQMQRSAGSIRVDLAKLDAMLNLAVELAPVRGRINALLESLDASESRELLAAHEALDQLCAALQDQVMAVRLVPIVPLFEQQIRTVRDLARESGKSAELRYEGGGVELDTALIERLRDPLTQMIRNAIAHGIETPEERFAAGKPATGVITLGARREGGAVVVTIADDGAGLDPARIRRRAVEAGLLGAETAMGDEELQSLIFRPGFSTAATITPMSGRGVGMDVVRDNVAALRGTISIRSTPGRGTCFTLRLPLTLALIDGFVVASGDETFVIPLDNVAECLDLPPGTSGDGTTGIVEVRGEAVPYIRLATALGLGGEAAARENVVLVDHDGRKTGIVVNRLIGQTQTVLKPVGAYFGGLAGIAGWAILGTGEVALILHVPQLIERFIGRQRLTPLASVPAH